ncbi:MAG: hypothetical protein P9L90_07935 [Candidatus Aadella gelida]|nr:hypothetical protein [Candidatus Aadella gelida]
MRGLVLIIVVLTAFSSIKAEGAGFGEIQRVEFNVTLEEDIVVIEQQGKRYEYPPKEKSYAGIKKVEKGDLNGDGVDEYIISAQLQETEIYYPDGQRTELPMTVYGTTIVCEQHSGWPEQLFVVAQLSPGKIWPSFKLLDVDGDKTLDLMAIGYTYGHWKQLQIASWKNGRYIYLWNKGGGRYTSEHTYSVREDGTPQIKVGYPISDKVGKKQAYVIDDWEMWVFDGTEFVDEDVELEE